MLKLSNVRAAYGTSRVLFDVNLEVPDGKIVTLLGRNGMGKTTTVRAIMGLLLPEMASTSMVKRSATRRRSRSRGAASDWCRRGGWYSRPSLCART